MLKLGMLWLGRRRYRLASHGRGPRQCGRIRRPSMSELSELLYWLSHVLWLWMCLPMLKLSGFVIVSSASGKFWRATVSPESAEVKQASASLMSLSSSSSASYIALPTHGRFSEVQLYC
jgi:ABC-type Fe3+ transport system permease subunit